jgi:serpin B
MFLMNALYFKGIWTSQFDKDLTQSGLFFLDDGSTVNTQMMNGKVSGKKIEAQDYMALELPYGRQNFAMVILVPKSDLAGIIESFDGELWQNATSLLDEIPGPSEIEVTMPKFKFEYEKVLNDQLEALGMIDAFIPYLADLSGISDSDIFVSFVKQNTFVEVNEEGTEAAAVTTIGIELTSVNNFIVNKPFIFAIRERTSNTLLFIGKVVSPQ